MDEKFVALLDALIERAGKAQEALGRIKGLTDGLVCSEEHHRHAEVGYAKEALWQIYWLWTSDEFHALEDYVKKEGV